MKFAEAKAQKVIDFFGELKHAKNWHGRPFQLLPYQHDILWDVFGTMRPNGTRQYNSLYLEIPKKNGKSEFAAGLGLYLTCADDEFGAEVYGAAADRAQASLVFDVAVDMVDQCPELKALIDLKLSVKRMVYLPTKSFYQVLSKDSRGKQGHNTHGVIFDELHEQPDRRLYDTLTQGSGDARRQPLFVYLTTAGDDPDRTSICWDVHQKALRVLADPSEDPTFYPIVFGVDDDADPGDEKNWYKANPALGHIIDIEKIRDAWKKAQKDPADMRKFMQFRLNKWIKDKVIGWMPLTIWDKTAGLEAKPELLKHRVCYGGLDLSSKIDLTAYALAFPPTEEDPKWRLVVHLWMPEDQVEKAEQRDRVPYSKWIKEKFIQTTPGAVIDDRIMEKTILESKDLYDVREVGFDPWNAVQLASRLTDAGVTMVEVRQGYKSMSPAMKAIKDLALQKEFSHGGNPALRWMAGNTEVKQDENENIRPVKQKRTGRIDGIVATINAMACAILHSPGSGKSVYDDGDVKVLGG